MVLVDTSIWIDHFRRGRSQLRELLCEGQVLCHPYIIGEMACGYLEPRAEILKLLQQLPQSELAEQDEVLNFIEKRRLVGTGIGYIDAHLLASALLSRAAIWTRDQRLIKAIEHLNIPRIS